MTGICQGSMWCKSLMADAHHIRLDCIQRRRNSKKSRRTVHKNEISTLGPEGCVCAYYVLKMYYKNTLNTTHSSCFISFAIEFVATIRQRQRGRLAESVCVCVVYVIKCIQSFESSGLKTFCSVWLSFNACFDVKFLLYSPAFVRSCIARTLRWDVL